MKPTLYQIGEPPTRLKKARLDNIALVPASLLPFKAQYQARANSLPTGSVLICETNTTRSVKVQTVLQRVAHYFRTQGHQVNTLSLEQITRKVPKPRLTAETLQLAF